MLSAETSTVEMLKRDNYVGLLTTYHLWAEAKRLSQ